MKRVVRPAGFDAWEEIHPCTLRHSLALSFLESPGVLATLGQVLEHKHLTMTMRYLHPREEELAVVHRKMAS